MMVNTLAYEDLKYNIFSFQLILNPATSKYVFLFARPDDVRADKVILREVSAHERLL